MLGSLFGRRRRRAQRIRHQAGYGEDVLAAVVATQVFTSEPAHAEPAHEDRYDFSGGGGDFGGGGSSGDWSSGSDYGSSGGSDFGGGGGFD